MLTRLNFLEFELELAEQDLLDHDGSQLDAPQRIITIKEQIKKEKENGTN